MSKDLRNLRKNYVSLSKQEIFANIRKIRNEIDLKNDTRKVVELAYILLEIIGFFSEKEDFNSERVLFNQLAELAWWSNEFDELVTILSRSIHKLIDDAQTLRGKLRINIFNDLLEVLVRFPENKIIYDAISRAVIDIIKWATDSEILDLLEAIKEKVFIYPLVESIQIIDAKIYMNALYYLLDQNEKTILKIYNEFSCFSINNYEEEKIEGVECNATKLILGDDVNEILQEGAINAIINITRIYNRSEGKCEDCIDIIKSIIKDSEYLLRKDNRIFFNDVYRLSYTLDQFNLWNQLIDLDVVRELKEQRDKNEIYSIAESKLLAIQKNMRIEEYDSLKIGRRGIKLTYDINDINDIEKLVDIMIESLSKGNQFITLVEEVDAIIEQDEEIKNHLRESGQIPSDRKTVDELQDIATRSDDLTKSVTKEESIKEQLTYLEELEKTDERYLINHMMHGKALIFCVAMHGFNSPILNISPEDLIDHVESLTEKKMILELIEPLVRAVTLRAARLDGDATAILFNLLNRKGLKFISKFYKAFNFINNITRLISFLARSGQIDLLNSIIIQLETANRLALNEDEVSIKLSRAINEGLLACDSLDFQKKSKLIKIQKNIAERHSFVEEIQIKYVEGLAFLLYSEGFTNCNNAINIAKQIIDISRIYSKNSLIIEKAALGLIWAIIFCKFNKQNNLVKEYFEEIQAMYANHNSSRYLSNIIEIIKTKIKS